MLSIRGSETKDLLLSNFLPIFLLEPSMRSLELGALALLFVHDGMRCPKPLESGLQFLRVPSEFFDVTDCLQAVLSIGVSLVLASPAESNPSLGQLHAHVTFAEFLSGM